jgi:hypothetical protein
MRPATAEEAQLATTSVPSHGNGGDPVHGREEGPLAVAASILGVIVVIVFIVALGSSSVRRRMRDTPTANHRNESGPPTPKRGLFG